MADTAVAITAGTGTNIDTRTEATNGNHRQVVVLGDPATNAGVAPVDATNGLSVTLTTAIPAGTAAIGKLAANSGVDIGDVDVTSISAGETHIGEVGGKTVIKSGSITRPADTTAYASGDAITDSTSAPTVLSISGCARVNAGSGQITSVTLADSANQATKGDFDLYIFDTTFTADNDNAAFTPTDAEMETCLGIVSFSSSTAKAGDATSGAGGNSFYPSNMTNPIGFVCAGGSTTLYFALVARNAYTPVSAEKFTIRLTIEQN